MNLKEMWKRYLELENEGNKLYNEGYGYKSKRAKKAKYEVMRLWKEADKILNDFIRKNYGKGIFKEDEDDERIVLSNDVILYFDGNVYEPLEVVMKRIIKDHEEKK